MKSKIHLLFIFLFILKNSFAQFSITIIIANTPTTHLQQDIFIAGNFNNWNPADTNYIFVKQNDNYVLVIKNVPAQPYQFKFTRGNWNTVECNSNGSDIENRILHLSSDTVINYTIAAWKDDFVTVKRKHTLSPNVKIIDTAFFIPQLNRHRKIWIYLPKNYASSKQKYPVLYLHDGQNLFDEATSSFGSEWGVDETLDSLIDTGSPASIVVGIDNGQDTRMSEYNPYEFIWKDSISSKTFLAEGDAYLNFLSESLKPFIDKHYRTLLNKENTIIAGSSMGGLISYYAALKYSNSFGKAGIFSPAFWTAPTIKLLTDSTTKATNGKFFFYMGGQEGSSYINDMEEVMEALGTNSNAMIYSLIDEDGHHNEIAWRKWFAIFYKWIMADGYNVIL